VAWAITIVVLASLGRPWRIAAVALAIIVPLCRMYVVAPLPLDLIGGAALGITVASLVTWRSFAETIPWTPDPSRLTPERRPAASRSGGSRS
jgi:membrane-associated phospholipid phosphatase